MKQLTENSMTPLARVLAACEAQERNAEAQTRKAVVIEKMIQFAIALTPDELTAIGEGVEAEVYVYEHDGHEYRNVQIIADGDTVASITWHGHFTDPAYSEHEYQPGAWEAAVSQ